MTSVILPFEVELKLTALFCASQNEPWLYLNTFLNLRLITYYRTHYLHLTSASRCRLRSFSGHLWTSLAHFLLLRKTLHFFCSAFYSSSETWLYVCMCTSLSRPSVSNTVEAVGHSVRPHWRSSTGQEETFSPLQHFAFNELNLGSFSLMYNSCFTVHTQVQWTIMLMKRTSTIIQICSSSPMGYTNRAM